MVEIKYTAQNLFGFLVFRKKNAQVNLACLHNRSKNIKISVSGTLEQVLGRAFKTLIYIPYSSMFSVGGPKPYCNLLWKGQENY